MPPVEAETSDSFKEYARTFSVKTVHCVFEADPQGSPRIGIRLYFYHGGETYFLVDRASGGRLQLTGIPVRTYGSKKEPFIAEEDVEAFLNKELGVKVSFAFEI